MYVYHNYVKDGMIYIIIIWQILDRGDLYRKFVDYLSILLLMCKP